MDITPTYKKNIAAAALVLLALLSVYVITRIISEVKSYRYIGSSESSHTISVSGEGEASAAPDIATVTYTIREQGATAKAAEDKVNPKSEAALKALKEAGVADKGIRTVSFNTYPRYGSARAVGCYDTVCPPTESKIIGYEAVQTVTAKIRAIDDTGSVISALTGAGINEVSGPEFAIEDEDAVVRDARQEAIEKAREKAEELADDLGVRLVRIVNFQESGNYPWPVAYRQESSKDAALGTGASSPVLPTGENTITSTVTITYEIR